MARRGKLLIDWLRAHGAIIDPDASVSVTQAKSGQVITFSFTYDGKRVVRLTFSGVTAAERNVAMIAWLNGELVPGAPRPAPEETP